MTIETKYNIGQEVWGIPNGEPTQMAIARIYVKVHKNKLGISYEFDSTEERTYRLPESAVKTEECEMFKPIE